MTIWTRHHWCEKGCATHTSSHRITGPSVSHTRLHIKLSPHSTCTYMYIHTPGQSGSLRMYYMTLYASVCVHEV